MVQHIASIQCEYMIRIKKEGFLNSTWFKQEQYVSMHYEYLYTDLVNMHYQNHNMKLLGQMFNKLGITKIMTLTYNSDNVQ
jgi:hypothetical protein